MNDLEEYTVGSKAECLRCEHKWTIRKYGKPFQCPICKSPAWWRPKLTKGSRTSKVVKEREELK